MTYLRLNDYSEDDPMRVLSRAEETFWNDQILRVWERDTLRGAGFAPIWQPSALIALAPLTPALTVRWLVESEQVTASFGLSRQDWLWTTVQRISKRRVVGTDRFHEFLQRPWARAWAVVLAEADPLPQPARAWALQRAARGHELRTAIESLTLLGLSHIGLRRTAAELAFGTYEEEGDDHHDDQDQDQDQDHHRTA